MHIQIKQHWNYWKLIALNTLQTAFINRWTNLLFLIGKVVRVSLSILFLLLLKEQVGAVAGYTSDQILVFFLTYQFLDSFVQIFFRGVYEFDSKVRSGEFDFYLLHPINPLFRALMGRPDINDALFIIPTTLASIWLVSSLHLSITLSSIIWYILLLINGVLIAASLHILVLCLGVLVSEVQSAIWLYRDLTRLGQFPITMYREALRFALFFIVPVGIMITVPTQVLLQAPSSTSAFAAIATGITFFLGSITLWSICLKRYSSASS